MGMLLAGLLVVSPALVVVSWYVARLISILPAVVSFAINQLPFGAAVLLLRARKRNGREVESH